MLRTAENPLQFGLIWRHFEMEEAFGRPRPMTTITLGAWVNAKCVS